MLITGNWKGSGGSERRQQLSLNLPLALLLLCGVGAFLGSPRAALAQAACPAAALSSGSQHFSAAGGTGSFSFTTDQSCNIWTITPPAGWTTITAPSSLNGVAQAAITVNFTVAPNPAGTGRTTVILIDTNEDGPAPTGVATFTITQDGQAPVCPGIDLSPSSLSGGTAGVEYAPVPFFASGAVGPVSFAHASGTLPPGLQIEAGTIFGTPTQPGVFTFVVSATDSNQCTGARSYTIVIDCPPIEVVPSSLPEGMAGSAYPTITFSTSGGTAPVAITLDGNLPAGMALVDGTLVGTPTEAGTFSVTVSATDANGCTGSRSYAFAVTGGLTITTRGPGHGSATGEVVPTQQLPGLPAGTVVRLDAGAGYDSSFAGWSGHPDCQDGSVTIVGAMSCVANFVRLPLGPSVFLNDDCEADVFTYGVSTGRWSREILIGPTLRSERSATTDPGWLMRTTQLNASDRFTDLLGYNRLTGRWFKAVNDLQGGFDVFLSTWAPEWQVFAAELSGDAEWDVLLYNPITGAWRSGINSGPGDFLYIDGAFGPNWEVYPVELNGDGRTDVFLHDAVTGRYLAAVNDGVQGFRCSASGQPCEDARRIADVWETDWDVYPGDFDADGLSDLLLYNVTSGAARAVLTRPGGPLTHSLQLGAGWTIQVGDLDADGRDDVFLYNPVTGVWAQGLNTVSAGFVLSQGAFRPGWQAFLRHTYPQVDLRADVLMYEPSTGRWMQGFNEVGQFTVSEGQWEPNLDILAQIPSLPGRHLQFP